MSAVKLHWYWSTNPQKIRLALEELGIDYELVEVNLRKGEHHTPEFRTISPRGKVPVLTIDGTTLWESGAILTYLGIRHGGKLWPESAAQLATALNLLYLESAAFQDQASVFFFNRVILPMAGKPGDDARLAKAGKKIAPLLGLIQDILGAQDYLLGDFSLVDCAFAPWLPVLDLDEFPALHAWRARLRGRSSWEKCAFAYDTPQG